MGWDGGDIWTYSKLTNENPQPWVGGCADTFTQSKLSCLCALHFFGFDAILSPGCPGV
jgi:hypothetical protein